MMRIEHCSVGTDLGMSLNLPLDILKVPCGQVGQ